MVFGWLAPFILCGSSRKWMAVAFDGGGGKRSGRGTAAAVIGTTSERGFRSGACLRIGSSRRSSCPSGCSSAEVLEVSSSLG